MKNLSGLETTIEYFRQNFRHWHKIKEKQNRGLTKPRFYGIIVAGMDGLEPSQCRSQSPVPYRLGDIPLNLFAQRKDIIH